MIINLYTTLGCHLCEDAMALLRRIEPIEVGIVEVEIVEVEIADDDKLIEAYGIRIPVVEVQGASTDLGWPFDLAKLENYLRSKP